MSYQEIEMNTHQKIFFSVAVTLGVVAAAFASSPAHENTVAAIEVPHAIVVAQQIAPEVTIERALVLGHRSDVLVASNNTSSADNE
jgi:hypothetical protein